MPQSLLIKSPLIPTLPRCSAPSEAFVLWPSVLRATIPLRPRFVPHCGLRSINAARAAYSNPVASLVEALYIVVVLSAASLRRNKIEDRGEGGFSTFGMRLHDEGNRGQSLQVRQYCEVLSQAGV